MSHIVKMQFGSHVYGTNVPTSDLDYKGIFLPSGYNLVIQRAAKHGSSTTKEDPTKKNQAGDIDEERFSVQQYLKLLLDGQTAALDMLFTPASFYIGQVDPIWCNILQNRSKLIHSGTAAFVGYCRQQAAKYGVKGSRVQAMRRMLEVLAPLEDYKRLDDYEAGFASVVADYEAEMKAQGRENDKAPYLIQFTYCKSQKGEPEKHLEVCSKKVPMHATVKYTREIFTRIFNEWGERAKLAEKNEGIDWKATMHAVRVAGEAHELLMTGHITFPRPDAHVLLKIRKGELPYKEVELMIEEGLAAVERAKQASLLPAYPNHELADEIVYCAHKKAIMEQFNLDAHGIEALL